MIDRAAIDELTDVFISGMCSFYVNRTGKIIEDSIDTFLDSL